MAIYNLGFLRLPEELFVAIIYELPMLDILRCRLVCKRFNTLVQTSSSLQYKIELTANDLVHCPDSKLSASAALKMLREQQSRWRTCQWGKELEIHLAGGCRTYDLRHGIWAYGQNDAPDMTRTDHTKTITCFKLGGVDKNGSSPEGWSSWSLKDFDVIIRDFSIDPLADMLAIVVQTEAGCEAPFQMQLRNLSNGKVHPKAEIPILDIDMTTSQPDTCTFTVQLQSKHVGVLVRHDGIEGDYDYFSLWNWQTGEHIMSQKAVEGNIFDDFAFIDNSSLMLTIHPRGPAVLEIWSFDKPQGSRRVGGFGMPPTAPQHGYVEIHFDGNPSGSSGGPKSMDDTPYALAPVPKIISISFGVIEEPPPGMETARVIGFSMVMRPSLMLEKLAAHPSTDSIVLSWNEWGSSCTRWIALDDNSVNWEPCTVGGRLAVVSPFFSDGDDEGPLEELPQVICLYDFRPEIIWRYARDGLMNKEIEYIVDRPTVMEKKTIFQEDVYSELPYHVTISKPLSFRVSGVMIDGSHLVCTKAEVDDDWRKLIVLCF